MITAIFLVSILVLALGYRFFGGFLEKKLKINPKQKTPAHVLYDGVDYVPAPAPVLLGHHFSSIAGAGPVVGPIIAALAFGWLPALLWVLVGSIFIGGVHDFTAVVASIRHQGRSIAEIANKYLSKRLYKLFLVFIWLTLLYVLIVFVDLTAATFAADGGVASSSIQFMILAVLFGLALYRLKVKTLPATLIFVPLVFLSVYLGQLLPISAPLQIFGSTQKFWSTVLLVYCFFASVLPVWILLQPRDYLSSFLLYASILAGFFGILFTCRGSELLYPAFIGFNSSSGALFPFLFVTIACGAISGFHAIVSGGTTSKQLSTEKDAKPIGYGSMLIEAVVAVIALSTLMLLTKAGALAIKDPQQIYATGIAKFVSIFGISPKIGFSFGLLALSTFLLTTLDTATRLGRYILEEYFELKHKGSRYLSTVITLIVPTIFSLITLRDAHGNIVPAWKAIWPVFGTSNQLLAALTLLVITVWLAKKKISTWFTFWPMIFMFIITLWALAILISQYALSAVGIIAIILFVLAVALALESFRIVAKG